MLTAKDGIGIVYNAWSAEKTQAPFFCKCCNSEVTLKKGHIRVHHFAHKPPCSCPYGKGESEIHSRAKKNIYESIKKENNCSICELEFPLNQNRPDIYIEIYNCKIAIELQKTRLTVEEVIRRTKLYALDNIHVLWILPQMDITTPHPTEDAYKVTEFHKLLHLMYFGRLYVWTGKEALIDVYHFESASTYVETTEWYDEYGDLQGGGGYYRQLKSYKKLVKYPKNPLHLIRDFKPTRREQFSSSSLYVPACSLWQDRNKKWW